MPSKSCNRDDVYYLGGLVPFLSLHLVNENNHSINETDDPHSRTFLVLNPACFVQ